MSREGSVGFGSASRSSASHTNPPNLRGSSESNVNPSIGRASQQSVGPEIEERKSTHVPGSHPT